jgi:outer membrane lipoprotein-sorting protein
MIMRRAPLTVAALLVSVSSLSAQSADSLIAKYIQASGGMARIQAIQSLRRTGKYTGGGGFEATVVQENKRPNRVREEFSLQGMTGINAYDGKDGWKIQPWEGKRDPESLGEEETHSILDDADFDGPLVNYQAKGNKVEYQGIEQIEGSDAYKLKVTRPNGDVIFYYLDTEYYLPIRIDTQWQIRGAPVENEISLGDYKQVNGVYLPFSYEVGPKGSSSSDRGKTTYDKIEANVTIDDQRFVRPGGHQ